jgi:predicted metal-binding protein
MGVTDTTMGNAAVTVFVCVTCKRSDDGGLAQGRMLYDAVAARARAGNVTADLERAGSASMVEVTPVECLAVCKRPCTVALSGPGKWTCVVGDLDHEQHADDVIAAALSFAATENGIIPWRQRPLSFRKGVVARIPPLGFSPVVTGS